MRPYFVAAVAMGLAITACLAIGVDDPVLHAVVFDGLYNAVLALTGGLCLARARASGGDRWAWLMLGLAIFAWIAGGLLYSGAIGRLDPIPYPSIVDVFYVMFYPLAFGALALLLRARLARFPDRVWLDGLVGMLAIALAIHVATDVVYLFQAAGGTYEWGSWLNVGWMAAAILFAAAAWQPDRRSRRLGAPARCDPLTGLRNRDEFHVAIDAQVAAGRQEGLPFSVLLLELDGLKAVNDLRGHAEGDRLLNGLASALRQSSRPTDVACRVGGDVFGLVLPAAAASIAERVGERVRERLARLGEDVGVSFGAAEWPADGPNREAVVLRADVALYAAKRAESSAAARQTTGDAPSDPEGAQMRAYAADVRASYARELLRTRELHASYLATVRTLAAAVEAKDDYTGGHIYRVHELGMLLAEAVTPDDTGDPQLAYGFLLHDIGKLAVPDAVLTKPGKLTEHEWELMRGHPEAGARILENVPFLDRALDVVLHHHERWDGKGYPHGVGGEEIPMWARIFAVVDAVDAITSDRPYRAGRPLSAAVEQVLEGAGAQFDPTCARAFATLDVTSVEALLQHRPETALRVGAGATLPLAARPEG